MIAYLESRNIKVTKTGKNKDTVKTLWQKVKQIKTKEPMYDIDRALADKGIEIVRLPPYHPEVLSWPLNCISKIKSNRLL